MGHGAVRFNVEGRRRFVDGAFQIAFESANFPFPPIEYGQIAMGTVPRGVPFHDVAKRGEAFRTTPLGKENDGQIVSRPIPIGPPT